MNKNSVAIISLCSTLCQGSAISLSSEEWTNLALVLIEKSIQPEALLEYSTQDFINNLNITEEYARRLNDLIGRTASLYFELSKYENMGIGVVTRADSTYPKVLKRKLGNACPPLFYYAGDISIANQENAHILDCNQAIEATGELTVKFANSLMKEMKNSSVIKEVQKRKLLIISQKI